MSIPEADDQRSTSSEGAGRRVLVVDDNNLNRDLLRIRLEREGCLVTEAENGEVALARLRSSTFDLVLLDVMMPVLDGVATLRAIKEDPDLSGIPVIMVSAVSEMETVTACISEGADDYLTKPFNPVFLKARVRSSLERRRLQSLERQLGASGPVAESGPGCTDTNAKSGVILTLARLLECRDGNIGQHHVRVREYSSVLAGQLARHERYRQRIDAAYLNDLHVASTLHDIGMVALPEQILLKRGELTDQERRTMQRHTLDGASALREAQQQCPGDSFIGMAISIAEHHHERWDGQGYPQGLQAEAIPLCARIVALADVYDALTTRRSYKTALDHVQSRGVILLERGRHFDPDVVDAFLEREQDFVTIRSRYPDADEEPTTGRGSNT